MDNPAASKMARSLLNLCFVVIVSLLVPFNSFAAPPSFEVKLDDPSTGEIKAIFQDKAGFMWFGGRNSLLRYDAYKFQNIQALEQRGKDLKKVSPYFVTDIIQDNQGGIWIASLSGLYKFDAEREILIRPKPQSGQLDPVLLGPLNDIEQLPTGELITGGEKSGIVIFDQSSLQIIWRQIDNQNNPSSADAQLDRTVQKILLDSSEQVWISTNRGLNHLDLTTRTITLYIPDPLQPHSKEANTLIALADDRRGNIFGGTFGAGLYIFNKSTHQFRNFRNDPTNPNSISEDAMWQILVDSDNTIWVGLSRNNVSKFDPATEHFTRNEYSYGEPGAPAFGAVMAMYEDNNRNIWLGHYPAKVSFLDKSTEAISVYRTRPNIADSIGNTDVQAVLEDKQHNLWLGVGTGVDYFDRKTGRFKHYNQAAGNYTARGSLSGYIDKNNVVWFGTWSEGAYWLDTAADKFQALPYNLLLAESEEKTSNRLNDSVVWGFCETRDNYFWVATHRAGLSRYDTRTGLFTKYRKGPGGLSDDIAWNCFEDSKGRFWIGTANGLNLMDRQTEQFKHYLPIEGNANGLQSASVLDIYEDAKKRLWFATNGGLHLYREASDDFEVFTTQNGFVNDSIRALTGDAQGNLWLGTNEGIIQFNPETRVVKNYSMFTGRKSGAVNTGAALTTAAGEVVFGTTDGLVIFDVAHLIANKMPPPVVLTDFKIFAKSVVPAEADSVLSKVVNQTQHIILDHTKRMFSFEFSALNYRSSYKNQYAYMLEGFDQDWREIGHGREAQYTNINPGRYVFKVRASNDDGVWSVEPKTIEILQEPPPWKTWWAYTLYALLAGMLLVYLAAIQKLKQRKVEEQNKLLESKVAERTRDLAEKNRDIQILLINMRQGLLAIEADGRIYHEYSAYLESIFETSDVAGRDAVDFLFSGASLGGDKRKQFEAGLGSIVGQDYLNFELNADLLIGEYMTVINGREKILSLDWSPILDSEGGVEKLMVIVRDISELKVLETEAEVKRRDLAMVSQLLDVGEVKFFNYYESVLKYIKSSAELVANASVFDKGILGSLFRNMHTIKGNSRAFGFVYVSDVAHEAEMFFEKVAQIPIEPARNQMQADLARVLATVAEYYRIYTEVLQRQKIGGDHGLGYWMPKPLMDRLRQYIEPIKTCKPDSYQLIQAVINRVSSAPLSDVISTVIESVPAMAVSLGKKVPQVQIDDKGIGILEYTHAVLRDVFTHVIRNSVDHGLEAAQVRIAKGKNPVGTIQISAESDGESLYISIADDGNGLNLNGLYRKGLKLGVIAKTDQLTRLDVARLVFTPGLSTKEIADQISGRGVGMDAIKQFLSELECEVDVSIIDGAAPFVDDDSLCAVAFKLLIKVPAKWLVND